METLFTATYSIAVGIWVGAIVFQSAVVAPSVIDVLRGHAAGMLLRRLFPRFYRLGLACGAAMITAVIALSLLGSLTTAGRTIAVLSTVMIVMQAMSLWLVPHINAARDAGLAGARRFSRLHSISVGITLLVLLLGLSSLVMASGRSLLAGIP
ncbi:MAG TPA: DUF4149 domain-containing protein [Xanthomonadales bacterium]|nr:DUF4149 domain-containing protein [Xanthomonadales bacterium]